MANVTFTNVEIREISSCVPHQIVDLDNQVDQFGGDVKQIENIKKNLGLQRRRIVDENTTSLDLMFGAAQTILNDTDKNIIDGLICVTQTPDHFQPSNACILHGKLELPKSCLAYDVNLGCSGYVYGLWQAFMMISSGTCDNVLLLTGDTLSKTVSDNDRATAPLFGDAGAATLVSKSTSANETYFSLHTNGNGSGDIIIPAGAFRKPSSNETSIEIEDEDGNSKSQEHLNMNGVNVFMFSITEEPKAIKSALKENNLTPEDVDYLFLHQANKYIIENIAKRVKFPIEKVPFDSVKEFGNTSSASIPLALNQCQSLNDKKLNKVVLSGFGVGLSWATCITNLSNIKNHTIRILGE
jgi:3-oxoacyl-[acyl-carrier-protein] synthase-3